jgi:hypothetical protein
MATRRPSSQGRVSHVASLASAAARAGIPANTPADARRPVRPDETTQLQGSAPRGTPVSCHQGPRSELRPAIAAAPRSEARLSPRDDSSLSRKCRLGPIAKASHAPTPRRLATARILGPFAKLLSDRSHRVRPCPLCVRRRIKRHVLSPRTAGSTVRDDQYPRTWVRTFAHSHVVARTRVYRLAAIISAGPGSGGDATSSDILASASAGSSRRARSRASSPGAGGRSSILTVEFSSMRLIPEK